MAKTGMIFVMEVITKAWEHWEQSLTVVEFQPVTSNTGSSEIGSLLEKGAGEETWPALTAS